MINFASIPEGATILDVASGRGAVLFPAVKAASPDGKVTGIDISPGMIEQLNQEIALAGHNNVQIMYMDAEDLQFSDSSFDTILCGLGLFFLPHLPNALAEFGRVLKPGGQFVTSTFQAFETEKRKRWRELNKSFKERIPVAAV